MIIKVLTHTCEECRYATDCEGAEPVLPACDEFKSKHATPSELLETYGGVALVVVIAILLLLINCLIVK